MTMSLMSEDDVITLRMEGVCVHDIEFVNAWLFALGMTDRERHDACCHLMSYGEYSFCNIEYRTDVRCSV